MSILEAFTWCCELQTEPRCLELFRHGHPQSKIQWSRSRDRSPFWIPLPTNRNEKSAQISVVKEWHRNRYMKLWNMYTWVSCESSYRHVLWALWCLNILYHDVSWMVLNLDDASVPLHEFRSGFEWEPEIFPCRTLRNRLAHYLHSSDMQWLQNQGLVA